MREIKFRIWDEGAKRLVRNETNDYWSIGLDGCLWYGNAKFTRQEGVIAYPAVLMQCTGLKDKNGKEIYEGDVVSCIWDGFSYEDIGPAKVVVKADERGFAYGFFPFVVPPGTRGNYEGYFEVIGNIYENPELLQPI